MIERPLLNYSSKISHALKASLLIEIEDRWNGGDKSVSLTDAVKAHVELNYVPHFQE